METVGITIREVNIQDIKALREISQSTFVETFSAFNTEENMANYLKESFSFEKLSQEISHPGSSFYFAEDQGKIIGYLKINQGAAQSELKEDKGLEIERIYVLAAYHGKKVGQILFEKAIALAKELMADYVWLGVWEENKRAISFYSKNGFIPFDKHLFKLGDDIQTDIMMRLEI